MDRPPLPIRECKRAHYHEPTEEYWYWQADGRVPLGGKWVCRECNRENCSFRRHGEIRPRTFSTKRVRLSIWAKCGHERTERNTYTAPSTGEQRCHECSLLRGYWEMPTLKLIEKRLKDRRNLALKRKAARHAKLERDIANGTL